MGHFVPEVLRGGTKKTAAVAHRTPAVDRGHIADSIIANDFQRQSLDMKDTMLTLALPLARVRLLNWSRTLGKPLKIV